MAINTMDDMFLDQMIEAAKTVLRTADKHTAHDTMLMFMSTQEITPRMFIVTLLRLAEMSLQNEVSLEDMK